MIKLEISGAGVKVGTLEINGKENEIFADLFTAISLIYSNVPKQVQGVIKEAIKDDKFMDGVLDGQLKYKNEAESEEKLDKLKETNKILDKTDKILGELLNLDGEFKYKNDADKLKEINKILDETDKIFDELLKLVDSIEED